MDSNSVWKFLSSIPIGTVIAWVLVISTIIVLLCTGTIKLYKVFVRYTRLKDENEEQKKIIQKHDNVLIEVNNSLKKITTSLEEQKEVNLKQIRYTIVHICDDAIANGKITARKLRSLEEMYQEYVNIFNGNGYVKTLVSKVRDLPVCGKLDE